ncbi:MAG: VWA domain-containing protein [Acidobacteriota bacterium]
MLKTDATSTVPRERDRLRSLFSGVALLLALTAPGLAQEEERTWVESEEPLDTVEETSTVIEIQVPVNVVTRQGEPVRDLTLADFQILDQGKEQEISSFEIIDLATIEPGESQARYERIIPPAARRHMLFLFDLSFSNPLNIVRARQAAQRFVTSSMHSSDLAAVATHSIEQGTNLILTFTPDRAQLARAIDTLGAPRLLQRQGEDPLRFVIDPDLRDSGLATFDTGAARPIGESEGLSSYLSVIGNQMARMEKSYARGLVWSWTESMRSTARLLGSVEGRKHIVFFTEGFDGRLLLGRQPDTTDPEAEADYRNLQVGQYHLVDTDDTYGNTQLQSAMNVMLEEFRRSDSVLQIVDISGLRADIPSVDRQRRVNDDALFMLANETGGALFEDANDFGHQLDRVLERSSVTYLLSFRPSDPGEGGTHHRLKVRAKVPRGSKISHRAGYYTPRPYQELHPMEKALIASDWIASAAPKNELDVNLLAAPFRADETTAYLPVIIEIDGNSLLAGHDEPQLPVEFFTYVTDDKGEMQDFFTQLVTLDLSTRRDAFAATGVKYYGHLELDPGEYLIRVLARNARTGRTGVQTASVSIPEFGEREPKLLPPFFLEEMGKWFLVREQASEYSKTRVYPFTVNGEPYVPAALPEIAAGSEADLCLVAYNFDQTSDLALDAVIKDSEGQTVEGADLKLGERTITGIDGLDKLTATFAPRGLAAGEYVLEVALEQTGREPQINSIPFRVLQ